MNKLSYVCTIGPSMADMKVLEKLYDLGMSTIRFNMSYKHPKMNNLLELAKDLKSKHPDLELMFDSAGPEIRLVMDNPVEFKEGNILISGIHFDVTLNNLHVLEIGDLIYIKDGDFVFEIINNENGRIYCKALNDGVINNNNKIYNEKMYNHLPFMSYYDEQTIESAVLNNIDSFAISFVRNSDNIKEVKETFKKYGREKIKIISKIENADAIENLEEIILNSDEIMVARGDLSTLLPRTKIGYYQKYICDMCHKLNKPVMVATGVLASLECEEEPKISEILDLYNIVLDGAEKVVFTSETSVSIDPINVLSDANDIFGTINL